MTVLREGRDTLSPIHALQGTDKCLVARDSDLHSSGSQAVASTVDSSWPGQAQDSDETYTAQLAVGLSSHCPHTADVMYLLPPSFPLGCPRSCVLLL